MQILEQICLAIARGSHQPKVLANSVQSDTLEAASPPSSVVPQKLLDLPQPLQMFFIIEW